MYEDTDYDALERNVKYIPWKGKKEEWYSWHKTFLVRAMTHGYHGILVGLESVPSESLCRLDGNDVSSEKEIQQLQTEH